MATLKELRDERLRKLDQLKSIGINPYPANVNRTHSLSEITNNFDNLNNQKVSVVGRIINIRKFGKISFFVITDNSGTLQLFLTHDKVEALKVDESQLGYEQLPLLDIGDFIEVSGIVIKTQTDEISVEVNCLRLISKSIRPMPLTPDGFSNKEERLRRRYIDINVNKDVKERFIRRSKFWQATREYLNDHKFIEINVPVLEHTTGGADANPFKTHMNSLNQDFYLRISHELPLKRLIGAGYEKVYDIGPRFRNENYSEEHLPEHVAMEWYWAYADWLDGRNFMKDMYKTVIEKTFNKNQFKINNFEVDLTKDWQEIDYADTIKQKYNINISSCTLEDIKQAIKENNLEVENTENMARGIDKLWKNIRKTIAGPAWLINTPLIISPLSKVDPQVPDKALRFQAIIAGTEMGNGFSELNDPIEQLKRFKDQQEQRDKGDQEAMMMDIDYIEMLEYGMPPACGFGYSERLFWVFEGVSAREGVPFPNLRKEIDANTKILYPDIKL